MKFQHILFGIILYCISNVTYSVMNYESVDDLFLGSKITPYNDFPTDRLVENIPDKQTQAVNNVSQINIANNGGLFPDKIFVSSEEPSFSELESNQTVFDCVGTIFVGIEFSKNNFSIRNSPVSIEWINPHGMRELVIRDQHYTENSATAYRWSGMVLSRPAGGGLFSLFDPSAGMQNYMGDWKVNVRIGKQELEPLTFSIEC